MVGVGVGVAAAVQLKQKMDHGDGGGSGGGAGAAAGGGGTVVVVLMAVVLMMVVTMAVAVAQGHYPAPLTDWYLDDWVSLVYPPSSTLRLPDVTVRVGGGREELAGALERKEYRYTGGQGG